MTSPAGAQDCSDSVLGSSSTVVKLTGSAGQLKLDCGGTTTDLSGGNLPTSGFRLSAFESGGKTYAVVYGMKGSKIAVVAYESQ